MRNSLRLLATLGLVGCYTGVGPGAADGSGPDSNSDSMGESAAESDSGSDDSGDTDGDDSSVPAECEGIHGATASMVRLPASAYRNAVQTLLGVAPHDVDLPDDPAIEGFLNDVNRGEVQLQALQMYMTAAEVLADEAIYNGDLLPDCGGMADDACAEAFIASFGREAYRRPLQPEESAAMLALYTDARSANDFAPSISMVVQAFLQSPAFLYWIPETEEPDAEAPGVARLTDEALAARLALFLWSGTPDAELQTATDAGDLHDDAELETQVRRMLADGRFEANAASFHTQWLDLHEVPYLTRNAEEFPDFDETLAASMAEETERMAGALITQPDATLQDLLAGPETYVNGPLATLYGIDNGPTSEDQWERVSLPNGRRAGVLTQASVLAVRSDSDANTSPVLRGHFIRERVLCSPIPPPPTDLDVSLPAAEPGMTTRERYDWILEQENCSPCHVSINAFGYPYENFDAAGAWRDTEAGGQPIDASGGIVGLGDANAEVANAVEMAAAIASTEEAAFCYAENWYRYAHARAVDAEVDECGIAKAVAAFNDADQNLQEVVVAVATGEAFRYVRTQ